jgi:D-psicose/D-tagatose/L-ribulose 3-epimerase
MKIGMNLLLYTTAPDESIFPTAAKLKEMGYDGLEWPLLSCDLATAKRIGGFNRDAGLEATAVYVFGEGCNPIDRDPGPRKAALEKLREVLECTREVGATLLCGPLTQTLGLFTGEGPTPEEHKRAVEFLRLAGDEAAKVGVTIALEYLNRFEQYFINTAEQTARLLADVAHPNVQTMIDSFHTNIEEADLRAAIHTLGERLAHVHVSENNRGIPGTSKCIPWDDFFGGLKEIGYDGWLTVEAFGQYLKDLAAAARIWRPIFTDPEDLCRRSIAFVKAQWGR